VNTPYRNFDRQMWPVPCPTLADLVHKLYYADADHVFSADERFILAAVADAYRDLIFKTQVNRNAVIKELRKGPNT